MITKNIFTANAPNVNAQLNKYIMGTYNIITNATGISKINDKHLIFTKLCFIEAKVDINNAGITVKQLAPGKTIVNIVDNINNNTNEPIIK